MIFVMIYIIICIILLFFSCIALFRIWNPDISVFIKNEILKQFVFDRYWFFENKCALQKKSLFFIIGRNSGVIFSELNNLKNSGKKTPFEKPFEESKKPFEKIEFDDSILLFFHENLFVCDNKDQVQLSRRLRYTLYNILRIRKNKLVDGIILYPESEIFSNSSNLNLDCKKNAYYYSLIIKKICKTLDSRIPLFFIDKSEIINAPLPHLLKDDNDENIHYNFGFFHKSSPRAEKISQEIKSNIDSCVSSLEAQMQYFLQKSDSESQIQIILYFFQLKRSLISFSKNYCDIFYKHFNIDYSSMINFHFILNENSFQNEYNHSALNMFEYISKYLRRNSDFSNHCIKNKVYKNYAFSAFTFCSTVFIIYSLIASQEFFQKKVQYYVNSFTYLDNFMNEYSHNSKQIMNLDQLKIQSCDLINTANQLNHISFKYPLNFPSWESKLNEDLDKKFDSKFTSFFGKFIVQNFNLKVNDFLATNKKNVLSSEETSIILGQINKFVDENEKITEIYSNILSNEKGKTTDGLSFAANFLFGVDCLKPRLNISLFQNIDRNKVINQINIDYNLFKKESQNILNDYIQNYFNTIIKNNDIIVAVNKINNDLIQSKQIKKSEIIAFSKSFVSNVNNLQSSILKGQMDFQSLNSFFGNSFYSMYKEIEDNPTFGKEIFENINKIAEEQFKLTKNKLANFTPLGNNFPLIIVKGNEFSVNPLLLKLSDSLEKMFQVYDTNEQAQSLPQTKAFASSLKSIDNNLPPNALWSIDNIQSLLQRGSIFETASAQINKTQYPKELSDIFSYIEEKLNQVFWNQQLPASMQISNLNEKMNDDSDQLIDPYIQNIQLSVPVLKAISNLLVKYDQNDINTYLNDIIRQQIDRQLYKYNDILISSSFFSPIYPDFNWWDGESSPAYKAFSVTSGEDLKLYLSIQLFSLKKFFNKNINPILQAKNLYFTTPNKYLGDEKFLENFTILQNSLDSSAKGTTYEALQAFFINSVLPLRTSNCSDFISKDIDTISKKDFFSIKQNSLYHALSDRCQQLLIKQAFSNFDRFADNYNSAISGAFPFSDKINSTDYASLEDINFIFSLYAQLKKQDLPVLQKYSTLYKNRIDIQKFVKHMDSLQSFFAIQYNKEGNPLPVSWNVAIEFRTNSDKEILGNQIIDWSLQSGNQVIGSQQGNITNGNFSWTYLQPLQFSISLAKGSPYNLQKYSNDKNLFITNNSAYFTIRNRWSLLKFIEEYADCKKDHYCNKNDLKFDLPLNDKKSIRFYISLFLKNNKGTRINFPKFPQKAPYLLKTREQKGT